MWREVILPSAQRWQPAPGALGPALGRQYTDTQKEPSAGLEGPWGLLLEDVHSCLDAGPRAQFRA